MYNYTIICTIINIMFLFKDVNDTRKKNPQKTKQECIRNQIAPSSIHGQQDVVNQRSQNKSSVSQICAY